MYLEINKPVKNYYYNAGCMILTTKYVFFSTSGEKMYLIILNA